MRPIVHNVQHTVKSFVAHRAFADKAASRHTVHMQMANIRKLRKLSQRALADLVGVDASTIQRAETMSDTAMLKTYKMVAQALGVSLSDLFCDNASAIERELLAVFRRIPEDRHHELIRLLEIAATPPKPEGQ